MENEQKAKIQGLYRHLQLPPIEVLNIDDEYEFLDEELIEMLTDRINETLRTIYKLYSMRLSNHNALALIVDEKRTFQQIFK